MKLESGVGILKGMRAIGIEEAATIGAEFLDNLLRGHRTLRNGLRGNSVHYRFAGGIYRGLTVRVHVLDLLRLHQLHGVVGLQVLHHALRDQNQRTDNAEGQQHPQARAHHVDPEVADGCICRRAMPRMKAIASAMPVRCGSEVVVSQASHLGQVAHRALAGIGLPVGIGGERRRRIKR